MSDIDVDAYYSAGYFLIRKNQRPAWLDEPEGLVPDELISLESEFCPKVHLSWGWHNDPTDAVNHRTQALKFGINEDKWAEFEAWCAEYHGKTIEVWSMFRSTDAIRRFMKQFIPESRRDGFMIIGAGLHHDCGDDWKEPYGTEGVEQRILEQLPMEQGGHVLGFDVSSYAHHNFDHTWLSHGHHRGVFSELGIRPKQYGLLDTREHAILARDYTNAHDGYEYEYWLLVSYPLDLGEPDNE